MALTNPTKLINVQELSYFEGKLAAKYQAQAISVTGITATSVEGALAELASSIGSLPSAIVPKGTKAFAGLTPSTDLAAANVGFMWNISDAFTTTSDFVEGAGHSIPAGANVYVANPEAGVYKYDIFSGMYDLSGYATKVSGATSGNFAGLDGNGNLTDSGSKASDFATAAQGGKADSAIQGVKVNGTIWHRAFRILSTSPILLIRSPAQASQTLTCQAVSRPLWVRLTAPFRALHWQAVLTTVRLS